MIKRPLLSKSSVYVLTGAIVYVTAFAIVAGFATAFYFATQVGDGFCAGDGGPLCAQSAEIRGR
jgi:hypothetical protein